MGNGAQKNMEMETDSCQCEIQCPQGDTIDRVELGTKIKQRLADQNVKQIEPKKPRLSTSLDEDLNLLTGGIQDENNEWIEREKLLQMNPERRITKAEFDYLQTAKLQSLSSGSSKKYFSNSLLVHRFGISTALKCRLGFCDFSGLWKMYIYKENMNYPPSIIPIAFVELEEFIGILSNIHHKINEGVASGVTYLKPEGADDETWHNRKPEGRELWEKDVVYLKSYSARVRTVWNFGSSYSIYLNIPKTSETIADYFGPKIRLTSAELWSLIQILEEIFSKCPPYEQMLDFAEQN